MVDLNGRTPAVGDMAAKARVGTITSIDQSLGTAVVQWQDGTSSTLPVSCMVTEPASGTSNVFPWICYQKLCGQ